MQVRGEAFRHGIHNRMCLKDNIWRTRVSVTEQRTVASAKRTRARTRTALHGRNSTRTPHLSRSPALLSHGRTVAPPEFVGGSALVLRAHACKRTHLRAPIPPPPPPPACQLQPRSTIIGSNGRVECAAFKREVVGRTFRHVFYFQGTFPVWKTVV